MKRFTGWVRLIVVMALVVIVAGVYASQSSVQLFTVPDDESALGFTTLASVVAIGIWLVVFVVRGFSEDRQQ